MGRRDPADEGAFCPVQHSKGGGSHCPSSPFLNPPPRLGGTFYLRMLISMGAAVSTNFENCHRKAVMQSGRSTVRIIRLAFGSQRKKFGTFYSIFTPLLKGGNVGFMECIARSIPKKCIDYWISLIILTSLRSLRLFGCSLS